MAGAGPGAGAGSAAGLRARLRESHNRPSTPPRSLSGDVSERTIWAYWAQGYDAMPDFFKLCVDTWQRHNPHWDVRVLELNTVHEYLSEAELPNRFSEMTSHQAASDAVRLGVLCRYGGVYMDVSIIMMSSLDEFCWDNIASGRQSACVFYHPHYGLEEYVRRDFVESWFLATGPGNPFFLKWRDLLRELLHNRLDTVGLLGHPLYSGLDLQGIDRLNKQFTGLTFDFREYLFIHAMCHRLIETDAEARMQWRDEFQLVDAADTAFRFQLGVEQTGEFAARALVAKDPNADALVAGLPLMKLVTPHSSPLVPLPRDFLLDRGHLLGRLLTNAPAAAGVGAAAGASAGSVRRASSSQQRQARAGGVSAGAAAALFAGARAAAALGCAALGRGTLGRGGPGRAALGAAAARRGALAGPPRQPAPLRAERRGSPAALAAPRRLAAARRGGAHLQR